MTLRKLIAPLLFALGSNAAQAQDTPSCRNAVFPNEPPFALARIGGSERVFFASDMEGCPARGSECRMRSYVEPGDVVIINRTRDGYVCAFHPVRGSGNAGWLATRSVELLPNPTNPSRSQWQGDWMSRGSPTLSIRRDGAALRVSAQARSPGQEPVAGDSLFSSRRIAGTIEPAGQRARYTDDTLCTIDFTLLGDFLIAGDNEQCGGGATGYSGVYVRSR